MHTMRFDRNLGVEVCTECGKFLPDPSREFALMDGLITEAHDMGVDLRPALILVENGTVQGVKAREGNKTAMFDGERFTYAVNYRATLETPEFNANLARVQNMLVQLLALHNKVEAKLDMGECESD